MAERAEELREQLDAQRADITRTVEQIENRVVPGRILERRKYKMRRSITDFRDRLMGNDEPEYPSHWYAQPAAPLGPEYGGGQTPTQYSTEYSFGESGSSGGGRMEGARETMSNVGGHATDAAHGVAGAATGAAQNVAGVATGAAQGVAGAASGAASGVSNAVTSAPAAVRRQAQGSPLAMGMLAFGAGVVAAALLPESQREKQLASQATPTLQHAVEGAKSLGSDVAQSMKEPVQESVQQVKDTATSEAQALKEDVTSEAQAAKSDVQATVKE